MPVPYVPVPAAQQVEQFVSRCLDNNGCALQSGTIRHFHLEKLQTLRALLQDLHEPPSPCPVPALNTSTPLPMCASHALETLDIVKDRTMASASAPFTSAESLMPVFSHNGGTSTSGRRDSPRGNAQHASNMATPHAPGGSSNVAGRPRYESSSDGLPPFRPSHEQQFRSSHLSRMPDSDDVMFSSFMKTLDFVDPSEFPFRISRSLHSHRTYASGLCCVS